MWYFHLRGGRVLVSLPQYVHLFSIRHCTRGGHGALDVPQPAYPLHRRFGGSSFLRKDSTEETRAKFSHRHPSEDHACRRAELGSTPGTIGLLSLVSK